jgi:hypothetical protein
MSDVTVVLMALHLGAPHAGLLVGLATSAYILPGVISGLSAGSTFNRFSSAQLIYVDSLNRSIVLGLTGTLYCLGRLRPAPFVALLALAALTRPAGAAGERAFVRDLVAPDGYFPANSLIQGGYQVARVIGPGLAGLVAVAVGPGQALVLDAASFIVLATTIMGLPTVARTRAARGARPGRSILRTEFWRRLAPLFGLTLGFHALYGPFMVAFPLHVANIAARNGHITADAMLGLAWTVFGIGSVVGGLLAGRRRNLSKPWIAVVIAGLWGVACIILGIGGSVSLIMLGMVGAGLVYAPYVAVAMTTLLTETPPDYFSQVSAYWSSMTSIAAPIGAAATGLLLGEVRIPPGTLIWLSGVLTLALAIAYAPTFFHPRAVQHPTHV